MKEPFISTQQRVLSITMGSAVERTDEHVREYLIYRGFTSTLKHLDSEIKADKEKGFRVDKIIDQLQQLVQSYDLFGLKEYWLYLDRRLFSRLEDVYRTTVNKLRTSLYRYYVVNTVQKGNLEKTHEFFQRQASELQSQAEWRDWFILPFIPSPDQNPAFSPYFSRQWADTFLVSLHNFLSVLFQCMPQPVLLSFDAEVQRTTTLTEENEQFRQMLFALQTETRGEQQRDGEQMVQHKLPAYVQNMDRLGDTELDLVTSQRAVSVATPPSRNFFSTFLPQTRRTPAKPPLLPSSSSPSQQAGGKKEPQLNLVRTCCFFTSLLYDRASTSCCAKTNPRRPVTTLLNQGLHCSQCLRGAGAAADRTSSEPPESFPNHLEPVPFDSHLNHRETPKNYLNLPHSHPRTV